MTSIAERWMLEGEARGEARGEAKLVKRMWENGISIEDISRMTKLALSRVQELINLPLKN